MYYQAPQPMIPDVEFIASCNNKVFRRISTDLFNFIMKNKAESETIEEFVARHINPKQPIEPVRHLDLDD